MPDDLLVLLLFPFAIFGIWKLMQLLKEKILVKRGYYKVTFRMPNYRKITKLLRPAGNIVNDKNGTYPFSNDLGYVYFNGNTPEVEYFENGTQLNFKDQEKTPIIDPNSLASLGFRTYNLGKKHAKRKDNILTILTLVAAGTSTMTLLLLAGMLQGA